MSLIKDYENKVQTLKSGEEVEIRGFKAAVELIFDFAMDILPVLTEPQYQSSYNRDFWGQTWMSPPHQGNAKEVQNAFLKNVNPSLEVGDFIIKGVRADGERIEHILFLLVIPNGLDTVARIYNTENGVRAVTNKTRIRNN